VIRPHHADNHASPRAEAVADLSQAVAVTGYSGSGKTWLISRLAKLLSQQMSVGYLKNSTHRFSMDREGKDTDIAWSSGAAAVSIQDPAHTAWIARGAADPHLDRAYWLSCDCVLVEGAKSSSLAKLVVVDKIGEIVGEVERGAISNVAAFVVRSTHKEAARRVRSFVAATRRTESTPPVFAADDVPEIARFVQDILTARAARTPLYGLVLSGGASSRMGQDKGVLDFRGSPQVQNAFGLLGSVCDEVYVSVREQPAGDSPYAGLPLITDRFIGIGPAGGILSAMHEFPGAAWLVLGCDMPFVTKELLFTLKREREALKLATAFRSGTNGLPEPLCACYEPASRYLFHSHLATGKVSARRLLSRARVKLLDPPDQSLLENVNTPEEYRKAVERMAGKV